MAEAHRREHDPLDKGVFFNFIVINLVLSAFISGTTAKAAVQAR